MRGEGGREEEGRMETGREGRGKGASEIPQLR